MKRTLTKSIFSFISSRRFYYITLGLFILQAVWMALTAAYPMAFDEGFHYGIIRIYAQQWSPILTHQPPDPGAYGELIHDPSYLYHYLMSFPYRLVMWLFHQYNIGVLTMRFIDIILFLIGLIIFRKLLVRVGLSSALTNVVLFVTVLVPITPFLAGQINYDDLIVCLTPLFIWFTLNIVDSLRGKRTFYALDIVSFFTLGMLTSLVKYAFLPIFAASLLCIFIYWLHSGKRTETLRHIVEPFKKLRRHALILSVVALIVSGGLFLQRYGYNIAVYHSIDPDCAKVLSVKDCLHYGPWARNYSLLQKAKKTHTNLSTPGRNPIIYLSGWVHAMIYRLYFSINYNFKEYSPMSLPFLAAFIFGFSGLGLFMLFFQRITREFPHMWVLLTIILLYSVVLFTLNYSQYLEFGNVVAVNGRYLLPLLPLILAMMGLGFRASIQRMSSQNALVIKVLLVVVASLMTLDGGGILTYIIHSEPSWYWRNDVLTGFNMWVKSVASHAVVSSINQPIDHLLNDLLR